MAPERFGNYLLLRLLARGRCDVYEAEDTATQRVALKIFPQRDSPHPTPMRVQREASMATRVLARSPESHWLLIHDVGAIDGRMYLRMPLIEGIDLKTLLARQGPLTPLRAVTIVQQVAVALDTATAAGLASRDIAAESILVAHHDFAYLLCRPYAPPLDDKGHPDPTSCYGYSATSYEYSAPEIFQTEQVNRVRSETYSLACILYECLIGAPPFAGDAAQQITGHLIEEPPEPSRANPAVPSTFDGVIARGMAKNPDVRYAGAGELAEAARAALVSSPRNATQ